MGLQDIPVKLGTLGTFILGVVTLISALLNIWQLYKAKNIERLNSALHTTETEMNVYRMRAERQSKELAEANQTIGELNAKTDLSAVLTMLAETIALTRESVDLSRKFDRENSQFNLSIAQALEKHGETDREIYQSIESSMKLTAETQRELRDEIREHRKDARGMIERVIKEVKGK